MARLQPSQRLFIVLAVMTAVIWVAGNFVTVAPHPNRDRDEIIWDVSFGTLTALFAFLACPAQH